ncbi:MAG: Fic family protein [Erysipelotrichales bacterium]|nr:Fic family protein [Erysipelotrichales bacterium]
MIKIDLNNRLLKSIIEIEKNKTILENTKVPIELSNKFRKNTRKRSSYASNAIEGNPLTYEQAEVAIESNNRHFLKPEQEVRNYYLALEYLSNELEKNTPFSLELLLKVQKQIVLGTSKDKIGLRGPMPPGVLFAVYDSKTGRPEYIPPEYNDVPSLLEELIKYINESDDHPIIKAAILHYQLVTIHPFEDGNGRTARIMSNYILSYYGYGFKEIGSLEEYFSYNLDEYYSSLQMGLPALYYEGRNNPPHPEIWVDYFIKIFLLYANKVTLIVTNSIKDNEKERFNRLSIKAKNLLEYIRNEEIIEFSPIELSSAFKVSNRTIINWCVELCNNGYVKPNIVNKRVRTYSVIR